MRKVMVVAILAMMLSVLPAASVSADTFTFLPALGSDSGIAAAGAYGKPVPESVDVGPFPGEEVYVPVPPAKAIQMRYPKKITVRIKTNNLEKGAAYTVWFVVWNDPSLCVDGCGEDDLMIEGNSVFWATGKVVSPDGTAHFVAETYMGMPAGEVLWGDGLTNPAGAEIHYVIRSHGPPLPDPDDLYAQLNTLEGGCNVNVCADHQAAVFIP